jgi:hypothetical protein
MTRLSIDTRGPVTPWLRILGKGQSPRILYLFKFERKHCHFEEVADQTIGVALIEATPNLIPGQFQKPNN